MSTKTKNSSASATNVARSASNVQKEKKDVKRAMLDRSPSTLQTAQERRLKFSDHINQIITDFKFIFTLFGKMLYHKSRNEKSVANDSEVTLKELKDYSKSLIANIRQMKYIFKVLSNKRKRGTNEETRKINVEHVRGVYSAVDISTGVLKDFFTVQNFPILKGSSLIKNGIALSNTITILFYEYFQRNNLKVPENKQYIRPDAVMMEIFGKRPALFAKDADNEKVINTKKLSTFAVIEGYSPNFDPNEFRSVYSTSFTALNSERVDNISPAVRQAAINDHENIRKK